jgi:tRNA (mo5U34)-methyltransferase
VQPLRLEELPRPSRAFDTTFSMGVLYHQRSPLEHLHQLRDTLRSGGQLVLETIVLPGDDACAATPPGRYARMKNVWLLPTLNELCTWLDRTGFRRVRAGDVSLTTSDEQRRTEWMTSDSLADALDPADPALTIEGWPAPRRAVITATAP